MTFARIHLIPLLPKFLSQHPDLELEIVLDDRQLDFVQEPGELSKHQAVIYLQGEGSVWSSRRECAELAVTVQGRLRVTAAEGVRAAVRADAGLTIASEWMFSPQLRSGAVRAVLSEWSLPTLDLWAVLPTGRAATATARAFVDFFERTFSA